MNYKEFITDVPNWPIEGVTFKDITPLLENKEVFTQVIDELSVLSISMGDDIKIAGIECRGFIFGAGLAALNGFGFIPVRKEGKLPPPTLNNFSAQALQRLIYNQEPTTEPMKVYRGVVFNTEAGNPDLLGNLKVGSTFSDPAFLSTSTSRNVAYNFSYGKNNYFGGNEPYILEINIPKGSKVLSVNNFLSSVTTMSGLMEDEHLLPSGSSLKYVGTQSGSDLNILKFDLLPQKGN
jgi:hypothetical protein